MYPAQRKYLELVNPEMYQVFLFSAPLPFPIGFARHAWFVINQQSKITRWEFGHFFDSPLPGRIGIHKDYISPSVGMRKYPWKKGIGTESCLHHFVEGNAQSLAFDLCSFIDTNSPNYPLQKVYVLTGPNSNTYVQWVLDHFNELNWSLPVNAIGKNYAYWKRKEFKGLMTKSR